MQICNMCIYVLFMYICVYTHREDDAVLMQVEAREDLFLNIRAR